jgi:hypothetical protein
MSFRAINRKYLEPGSQLLMVLGIIAFCQPWSVFLHSYGVTITLVGLVMFNVTNKIGPEKEPPEADDRPLQGAQH